MFLRTNYLEIVWDNFCGRIPVSRIFGDKLLGICVGSFLQYVVRLLTHVLRTNYLEIV